MCHNPTSPESLIERLVDQITSALFSVVVTHGSVPIIKCQKGNIAEAVAKKLDSKLVLKSGIKIRNMRAAI